MSLLASSIHVSSTCTSYALPRRVYNTISQQTEQSGARCTTSRNEHEKRVPRGPEITIQRKRKRATRNRDTGRDRAQAGALETQEARKTRKTRKLRQNTITYYHGQPKRKRKEETASTNQQEIGQRDSGNTQDRKKRKGVG